MQSQNQKPEVDFRRYVRHLEKFGPKISGTWVSPPIIFCVGKLVHSYGIKLHVSRKKDGRSFFRFVTIHAYDRQTDRPTDISLMLRPPCIDAAR